LKSWPLTESKLNRRNVQWGDTRPSSRHSRIPSAVNICARSRSALCCHARHPHHQGRSQALARLDGPTRRAKRCTGTVGRPSPWAVQCGPVPPRRRVAKSVMVIETAPNLRRCDHCTKAFRAATRPKGRMSEALTGGKRAHEDGQSGSPPKKQVCCTAIHRLKPPLSRD
jgi:hypothetical protein